MMRVALENPNGRVWWRIFPSTRTTWRALRMPSGEALVSAPQAWATRRPAAKTPKPGCHNSHAIHSLMLFVHQRVVLASEPTLRTPEGKTPSEANLSTEFPDDSG